MLSSPTCSSSGFPFSLSQITEWCFPFSSLQGLEKMYPIILQSMCAHQGREEHWKCVVPVWQQRCVCESIWWSKGKSKVFNMCSWRRVTETRTFWKTNVKYWSFTWDFFRWKKRHRGITVQKRVSYIGLRINYRIWKISFLQNFV